MEHIGASFRELTSLTVKKIFVKITIQDSTWKRRIIDKLV